MFNNWSDQDLSWWPFLFLRPRETDKIASWRIALIATLHGALLGVIGDVLLTAAEQPLPLNSGATLPLLIGVALFLFVRFTVAYAWNRRAARLSRTRAFSERVGLRRDRNGDVLDSE
jgi:hypothetical protein